MPGNQVLLFIIISDAGNQVLLFIVISDAGNQVLLFIIISDAGNQVLLFIIISDATVSPAVVHVTDCHSFQQCSYYRLLLLSML